MKNRGFTLIEIILVVALLTVVLAVTIPNFDSSYKSLQLRSTVDHMAYLLRYAQSHAVAANRQVRLEFNGEFTNYWLSEEPKNDDGQINDGDSWQRVRGRLGREFSIPENIDIKISEGAGMFFYPDGRIEKKHITVCQNEKCFIVSTKEQRGRVQIYDAKDWKG